MNLFHTVIHSTKALLGTAVAGPVWTPAAIGPAVAAFRAALTMLRSITAWPEYLSLRRWRGERRWCCIPRTSTFRRR